jgi:hypothetical protein
LSKTNGIASGFGDVGITSGIGRDEIAGGGKPFKIGLLQEVLKRVWKSATSSPP